MQSATRDLISDPNFRRFFASRFISNVGNGMQPIALAFGVLAIPGATATSLSIVLAATAIAVLVVLPFGGALADRYGAARLVGAADITISLLVATQAILFITGTATVPVLAVLALGVGALNGLWYPAFAALTPDVVAPDRLQPANALVSIAQNVGYILGASAGGAIVALAGSGVALAVDSASFVIAGLLVWSLRHLSQRRHSGESMLADIISGWAVFVSFRWVVVIVVAFSFIVMSWHGSEQVLGPVLADDAYGGPRGWSIVLAAQAIGLLVGGLLAVRARFKRPLLIGMVAMIALPAWQATLAFALPLVIVSCGAFLVGIAIELLYVLWTTAVQSRVPRESLSRVSSYDALGSLMLGPLGIALAGPLVGALGLTNVFLIAAAISAAAILGSLLSRSVRNLTVHVPDAPATVD
jgi:MFS family permease